MNEEPYTVISGAMQYFRIPREYWDDRLQKLKECGFNTVETYTCWNLHEPSEGIFNFDGMLDLEKYIDIAAEYGLNVILRPGPYICAEWEMGGLPAWLLNYSNIKIRCNDDLFISKVERYYNELLRRIKPKLCTNGGNIIMMQIENEYGSYGDDHTYMSKIAQIYKNNGIDCLLFTSDGASYSMLQGGTLPEYPCVANFGSAPAQNFKVLNDFRPNQPLMCGEYWVGWFDHWYDKHHVRDPHEVASLFKEMIDYGASLNFYMFHGGTNFGFMNGANHYDSYEPTITSYDYNALLSESGDLTPAYFEVRKVIEDKLGKLPPLTVKNTEKKAYGEIELNERCDLFEAIHSISNPIKSPTPLFMEDIGQYYGYTLYSSTVDGPRDEKNIVIDSVNDRALIFINGEYRGVYEKSRDNQPVSFSLSKGEKCKIDILCENMGRVNYGPRITEKKGINSVRFGLQNHFGWEIYPLPLNNIDSIKYHDASGEVNTPTFLKGKLRIYDEPCDSFIKLNGFTKGVVFINGFNIGRYFNPAGPQKTLYVPAPLLVRGENKIVVFESDYTDRTVVEFVDKPDLG